MSDAIILQEDLIGIAMAITERGLVIAAERWAELEPEAWEFLRVNIDSLHSEMVNAGLTLSMADRLANSAMLVCLVQVLAHRAALDRLWMDCARGTPLEKLLYEERDDKTAGTNGKPASDSTDQKEKKKKEEE